MAVKELDSVSNFWSRVDHQLSILNLTYRDLWISTKTSYSTGMGWKQKNRYPVIEVCVEIARILGTTVEYLVTGVEIAFTDDDFAIEHADGLVFSELAGPEFQPRSIPADILSELTYMNDDQYRMLRIFLRRMRGSE